jgi:hypothetical protein
MATTAPATKAMRRAGEFTSGIGNNLTDIADRDVALMGYTISERRVYDARQDASVPRTFVEIDVQELDEGKPNGHTRKYHAWSPALAERLSAIPLSTLPILARFHRVATQNSHSAWVVD